MTMTRHTQTHHTDPQRCPTWSEGLDCTCDNCCPDYPEGMAQLNGAILMSAIHHGSYTMEPFRFCPWCGQAIKKQERA